MKSHRILSPFHADFLKGGQGSGNFRHQGRPGEVGGSGPGGAGVASSKAPEGVIPIGRQWIDAAPGLPKDTLAHYTHDGKLDPERQKLHDKIKTEFLDHVQPVPEGQQKHAIFMMGGTASGKSSLVRGKIDESKFVKVDADGVKERLPEYQQAISQSARNAAEIVHEESSALSKEIREAAIASGKNFVFDGTGKNADKYVGMMERAQSLGYKVTVIGSHLDVETAKSRSRARAEKTGRWVPEHFIDDAYHNIPRNFKKVMRAADSWALYDNRGSKARLVWESDGGKEVIHDPEFLRTLPG